MANGTPMSRQAGPPWKVLVKYHHGLGDVLCLTAALESLHLTYPGEYVTAVDTTFTEVWENNPRVVRLHPGDCHIVCMGHPPRGPRLVDWLARDLGDRLGRPLSILTGPVVYLSPAERVKPYPALEGVGPYVVVNASRMDCLSAKWAGRDFWQKVVDGLAGKLQVVQVGGGIGPHPKLAGVIDLTGRTTIRGLIQVVHHSVGAVGPESHLNHLSAALGKSYLCVAGGRCGPDFPAYPTTTVLSSVGKLSCCASSGCWKSRVEPDTAPADRCVLPVLQGGDLIPECMRLIDPDDVVRAVLDKS